MNIFLRNKVKIYDSDLRNLVIKWTNKEIFPMFSFSQLLQSIGIVTPVTLCNFNSAENSFECIDKNGKVLLLILLVKEKYDFCNQLVVKDGELYYYYDYCYLEQCLELDYTVLKRNGNILLYNYFNNSFFRAMLILKEDYYVDVRLEPSTESFSRILFSKEEIQNYLLGLKFPVTAQNIYDKIMDISVSKFKRIKVFVGKIKDGDVLSGISKKNGIVKKYFEMEDNISFGIEKKGDWIYKTPFVSCFFSAKNNSISVTVDANKTEECNINAEIEKARKKVESIRDKIN